MTVPNRGLLAVMRSILERDEADIVKVLPPDGVVISLADESVWVVTAYPQKEKDSRLRLVGDDIE